jgi:hypothetical protein
MERKPQVYWFKANKSQNDVLIFDAGRNQGFVHIYELKETLPAGELENQLKLNGFPMTWVSLQRELTITISIARM